MPGASGVADPRGAAVLVAVTVATAALAFANGGYSETLVAGATIGVWVLVAVGVLAGGWARAPIPRAALAAGACLAALVALSALSMIWANDAGRAFVAFVRADGYLGLFALVALAAPRMGARVWLIGLAAGLTLVTAAALGTRFDPSLFGGGDRELNAALPATSGLLSYPIGYWNGLAACVAIAAVLLGWLGARSASRAGRALAVALIPLPVLALYLTASRGGLAAVVAGGLGLLAFERSRATLLAGAVLGGAGGGLLVALAHGQSAFVDGLATSTARDQGLVMGLATLGCVIAVGVARYALDERIASLRLPRVPRGRAAWVLVAGVAIVLVAINPVSGVSRFANPANPGAGGSAGQRDLLSPAGSGRSQYWEAAIDAFGSRPATGIGAGNYSLYWNDHPEIARPLLNAHSLYLETLAELGALGLAAVLGFFAAAALAAWRGAGESPGGAAAAAAGIAVAGAVSAGLDWTWQLPAAFAPVVVAVALLTSGAGAGAAAPAVTRARPRARLALAIAAVAVAWASVWAGGVVLFTDLKLDASRAAASRGDLEAAADDARQAESAQPWSPEPPLQLALVEELGGDLGAARRAAGEAIDRAQGDWRGWAVAGRIDARRGAASASQFELGVAGALSPVPLPTGFTPATYPRLR
ncbi:MAG TPA: O-antigen ligase family protein [Solirubrobacterales bacterium]|nr:O-antigen ligase family protein [Solirubrobacterales bacterium]